MALFKPFKGSRVALDAQEKHDGYAYFCTDDGSFHIDYVDANGNLQRKQINAKEAEALVGYDIATVLISSEVEIPTSKAVMDALNSKVEKVDGSRLITATEAEKIEKLVLGNDGSVTVSGKIAAGNVDGLADWITARAGTLEGLSENNLTDALVEKLNGIETSAQVNTIESITVNGIALDVSNKIVDIPMATLAKLGVVKSSTEDNKVVVSSDGTMEVNNVNVNKLIQDENDILILNGSSIASV